MWITCSKEAFGETAIVSGSTAELIDARNGFTIWSETYEREMQGIFALQDEITCSIVDALKLKLEISPPPRAAQHGCLRPYLQGLFLSDKSTRGSAAEEVWNFSSARSTKIRDSLARGPGIAKSWLWLADAYVEPLEAYSKVREAAVNAFNIDDSEAEAHVYLAETKRILDWDLRWRRSRIHPRIGNRFEFYTLELFHRCILRRDR